MSHVWGQTIPTNHWKLKHPQREFAGTEDVIERKVRKEIVEGVMESVGDTLKRELRQEMREKIGRELADSLDYDKLVRNQLDDMVDTKRLTKAMDFNDLINNKRLMREMVGEASEGMSGVVQRNIRRAAVSEAGETLVTKVDSPLKKTMVRWGVGGAVVVAGFALLINSDALNQLVEAGTGMDCDRRATEASYIEGTPEYTESVETCQKEAADRMVQFGKILAYGGIGIAGLIGLIVVMRFLPKKKEGADDEE